MGFAGWRLVNGVVYVVSFAWDSLVVTTGLWGATSELSFKHVSDERNACGYFWLGFLLFMEKCMGK